MTGPITQLCLTPSFRVLISIHIHSFPSIFQLPLSQCPRLKNNVSHTSNLLGSRVPCLLTASFPSSAVLWFVPISWLVLSSAPPPPFLWFSHLLHEPRGTREPFGNLPILIVAPTDTISCEQVRATCIHQRAIPSLVSTPPIDVDYFQPQVLYSLCGQVSGE